MLKHIIHKDVIHHKFNQMCTFKMHLEQLLGKTPPNSPLFIPLCLPRKFFKMHFALLNQKHSLPALIIFMKRIQFIVPLILNKNLSNLLKFPLNFYAHKPFLKYIHDYCMKNKLQPRTFFCFYLLIISKHKAS